ncbi:hypothetical protein FCM35_KLT06613 [Carex littledalei]|uniref:Uncharacterized protein n=1 Tax=Carex littledalei TaxID=544730 RepID=A0A833QXT6_9POAL|nr:hypothetical protein FCM35_KLT06613 [Carex littledalei]
MAEYFLDNIVPLMAVFLHYLPGEIVEGEPPSSLGQIHSTQDEAPSRNYDK